MQKMRDPMFTLYVVWHPSYRKGRRIADLLRTHFGRDRYPGIREGRAVSVLERSRPLPGALTPIPINWDYSEFTAVIVLLESTLAKDRAWSDYVRALANTAHKKGLLVGFFPVTMDRQGLEVGVRQQALRWDR